MASGSPSSSFEQDEFMISGDQFVLYCTGMGTLIVSVAVAVRILTGGKKQNSSARILAEKPKWEPIPDPTADVLTDRLAAFSNARFASPIVQRVLSEDAGPLIRKPTPLIPRRHQMMKPPQLPQRRINMEKVVKLPLKQRKGEENE
jgi:hypothetical protein